MDIAPTILDALGVTADSAFEGISLWPVLTGEARAEHRAAVSEMRKLKSLLEYPWKLIRHSETRRIMLFDLESDAGESRNLRAARPEVVSAMELRLDRALGGRDQTEVPELDVDIQDEELEEQLRALGYVD
jgi:arylsulfatase A-like enzyme